MITRRPGLRTVAAMAAALLLSACWSGPALFTAREATPNVLADGIYLIDEPGKRDPAMNEPSEGVRIINQPDGSMRALAGDNDKYDLRVLAVALPAPVARRFVLQISRYATSDDLGANYLLLDARDGKARLLLPHCSGEIRDIVTKSGGSVSRDPNTAASCDFHDRDVLLAQLKRLAAMETPSRDVVELTPYRR